MKKIWLTLLSLVVAVVFQVTNVQAADNQVSFAKTQDNVAVNVSLPTETQVHALKVTLKVTSQQKTAPSFEFTPTLKAASKVHEIRYDSKKQEVTLYLADLNAFDFSSGIDLGEFSNITTKTTFSTTAEIEIVAANEKSVILPVQATSLVVNETAKDPSGDEQTTPDDKNPTEDKTGDKSDTKVDGKYTLADSKQNKTSTKQGVLGQTGEQKALGLTVLGMILLTTVGAIYLKFR